MHEILSDVSLPISPNPRSWASSSSENTRVTTDHHLTPTAPATDIGAMASSEDLSTQILNNPDLSQKLMAELIPIIYKGLKATA